MDFGFTAIAAITVICYLVSEIVKITTLSNKIVPAICGGLGGVLGVIAMYVMPEYPANDVITAVAIGIVSGLAATGVHEVGKLIKK